LLLGHIALLLHDREHPGDIRLVLAAELTELRRTDPLGIAQHRQQINRVRAPQAVPLHLPRCQLVPMAGDLRNRQRKPLEPIYHPLPLLHVVKATSVLCTPKVELSTLFLSRLHRGIQFLKAALSSAFPRIPCRRERRGEDPLSISPTEKTTVQRSPFS